MKSTINIELSKQLFIIMNSRFSLLCIIRLQIYTILFALQQQYKDIQSSSLRTNTTVVNVHDDDEG